MIDLKPQHLDEVRQILAEHVPGCEVRAFGSRAKWSAREFSDLDLAVVGDEPLDWRVLGKLQNAFEESDLPITVDVLDWHAASESFRRVIDSDYTVVLARLGREETDRTGGQDPVGSSSRSTGQPKLRPADRLLPSDR